MFRFIGCYYIVAFGVLFCFSMIIIVMIMIIIMIFFTTIVIRHHHDQQRTARHHHYRCILTVSQSLSLWRDFVLFFALLTVAIWLANRFVSSTAWAPTKSDPHLSRAASVASDAPCMPQCIVDDQKKLETESAAWIEYRSAYVSRCNPGRLNFTQGPKPKQKSDQRAWHVYEQRTWYQCKQWVLVPTLNPVSKLTEPLAGAPIEAKLFNKFGTDLLVSLPAPVAVAAVAAALGRDRWGRLRGGNSMVEASSAASGATSSADHASSEEAVCPSNAKRKRHCETGKWGRPL